MTPILEQLPVWIEGQMVNIDYYVTPLYINILYIMIKYHLCQIYFMQKDI